jgi:hypothetical protein
MRAARLAPLQAGAEQLPHLPGTTRGGSIEPNGRRGTEPLLAAVFVVYEEEFESLVKSL